MSNTAVYGIYRDTVALGGGLERLKAAGFRSTDVSVLMPENIRTSSTRRTPRRRKARPPADSQAALSAAWSAG